MGCCPVSQKNSFKSFVKPDRQRIILQENNKEARDWYEQEAAREMWGTRTLQRNAIGDSPEPKKFPAFSSDGNRGLFL